MTKNLGPTITEGALYADSMKRSVIRLDSSKGHFYRYTVLFPLPPAMHGIVRGQMAEEFFRQSFLQLAASEQDWKQ